MLKHKFKGKIHKNSKKEQFDLWTFYCTTNKNVVKKIPKSKKNWYSLLFFAANLLVIGIVFVIQLNSREGVSPLSQVFETGFRVKYILYAFLCFIVANLISGLKLNIYHIKLQKKSRFVLCNKAQLMGKYYTKLTPMGVGGQPFQVYYFNKYKVKTSNSLTMVSSCYVSNKLVYGIIALIMMITYRFNDLLMSQGDTVNIVIILATISFIILAGFLTFVILLCVNKKLGNKIITTIIKLLTKIKIIKNPGLLYLKVMKPTLIFQRKMKKFFASKLRTLLYLVLSVLEYVIEYSVPFFIYSAFNGLDFNMYMQLLSISFIIELACHVVPVPGGSGMAELSFYAVFASLFAEGCLFWALLLWRFINYYLYLLIGFGIIAYDYAYGNYKRNKRISNSTK